MIKFISIFLCVFTHQVFCTVLPANVISQNCRRFDPNLNSCLVRRAGELLNQYVGGVPNIIPSLDPLYLDNLEFSENKGPINLNAKLNDVILIGHKDAKFSQFTFDVKSLSGIVKVTLPTVLMKSTTAVQGTVLSLPVNSVATFNWKFDNVKYECKYKLQVVNHQGHDYLDIVDLQMTSHSDDGALEIESTDPANQLTDKALERAFNSNPRGAMDALNDFMTKSAAEIYKNVFNTILHKFPADELLPK